MTTTRKRLTIVRWIDASPERVFDSWLDRGRLRARLRPAPFAFRECSRPQAPTTTPTPQSPPSGSRPIAGGTKVHLHACVPDDDNDTEDRWSALTASC